MYTHNYKYWQKKLSFLMLLVTEQYNMLGAN